MTTPTPEHKGELSALIASIRAGLEGVSRGPWGCEGVGTGDPATEKAWLVGLRWRDVRTHAISPADAAHIARLSPDNVLRLLDELDAREARALAAEKERDGYRSALTMIAHTFAENSFGGDKLLPANEYQDMARQALKGKTP